MAKPPSPELQAFMAKHEIDSDEIWPVRDGDYAIKHFAIERVAARAGIKFERPAFLEHDTASGVVSMVVFGRLGDREEWSTGEASPKNNKNQYPYAMAEKRAKGRVALKLLIAADSTGAVALYSEEDSDDFKKSHKNAPDGYLDGGEPIPSEHIITRDDGIQILTTDAQRPIFSELEKEMLRTNSVDECKRWKVSARTRASRLSGQWKDDLNDRYLKHLRSLEKRDALEYQERMTG